MSESSKSTLEYSQNCENLRHFANVRFAQLTLFFALSAAIFIGLFQSDPPPSDGTRNVLRLGGIVTAALFLLLDVRIMEYWHHFRDRAIVLEKKLGFQQYSSAPVHRLLTATNIIKVLYLALIVFWVLTFFV